MSEVNYLSKVVLILSEAKFFMPFVELIEKMQEAKISCQVLLAEEEVSYTEEALYVTDCPICLSKLKEEAVPVLAYLHEENRNRQMSGVPYAMENPMELSIEYLERVYRRYFGIPWEIVRTDRCIIRESTLEDVDAFYEIYKEPSITKYTEQLFADKNMEKAYMQNYIETVYPYFEYGFWTVIWKETGEIIGRAGLSVRDGFDSPELGYVIGVPWQGKGVAYEVCSAILEYGREELGMEEIRALIRPGNEASFRLCEKLGFVYDRDVMVKDILHKQVRI